MRTFSGFAAGVKGARPERDYRRAPERIGGVFVGNAIRYRPVLMAEITAGFAMALYLCFAAAALPPASAKPGSPSRSRPERRHATATPVVLLRR
jgi:hypothetical protein